MMLNEIRFNLIILLLFQSEYDLSNLKLEEGCKVIVISKSNTKKKNNCNFIKSKRKGIKAFVKNE